MPHPDPLHDALCDALGAKHVLTGEDCAPWQRDWTGAYTSSPRAVVRPASTAEVSATVRLCVDAGVPMVPMSGNTGVAGGGLADGAVVISLDRMTRIRAIKPEARIAVVDAGVVLATVQERAAEHGLSFPLTFGARGSARIGGCLSTNAGGSNVLRHGTARALCLGIEAVMPDGAVLNLMSELHKDNTGYDLRDLMIGAEGTLGIITGAVLKLSPAPLARATAMIAVTSPVAALDVLNRLQAASGGAVEAFEYMPALYIRHHLARFPGTRPPFDTAQDHNVLVEITATSEREAQPGADGQTPLAALLETALAAELERGTVIDAVIAQSEAERREMWERRENAAEIALTRPVIVNNDIAVPLDKVAAFLDRMDPELKRIDPSADLLTFAHLGDGNIHYTVWPGDTRPETVRAIASRCEEIAVALGGTFSAEHGVGASKVSAMGRLKDPVALAVMRRIKDALDPQGLMNPGKVLPG